MKAAVALITVIIVVAMVVSIGLMFWLYMNGYFIEVRQSGEKRLERSLEVLSTCMRIEESSANSFFIRNCGNGIIKKDSLKVYVDGESFDFGLSPSTVDGGKAGTLTLYGGWGMSIGQHSLRITNPNTEAFVYFEAELPDSCVLALDFDEGSGTIAHDSSVNGNDGILNPNVTWTSDGKFGSALNFNASLNVSYVTLSNLSLGGTNTVSVEAWIRYTGSNSGMTIFNYGVETVLFWINKYGTAIFCIRNTSLPSSPYSVCSPDEIPINQYVHLMGTYDGSYIKIYVNGVLKGNDPLGGMIRNNDNDELTCGYTIGGKKDYWASWNWDNVFNGTIDSIRVYKKVLTPDETLNFRII